MMRTFKNESIPLIKLDPSTQKLILTTEACTYLSSLRNPVSVVSISGLYRTGKSYLINRLVPFTSGQQAFQVGCSTQSMTKGLNILSTPISLTCSETGQQIDYLLIDSQGIGSCEQSLKYDNNLLILLFLISSTVVYNSMGAIDECALQQLQFVMKLKQCVQRQEHEYDGCSFRYMSEPPKLLWVLRDFALQLVDKDGRDMTPDGYLEYCLQESPGQGTQSRKKNEIRRAIKQNIRERHCYTLVRPTINEQELHLLSGSRKPAGEAKLRDEFLSQIESLKEQIFRGSERDIKRINGQPLTGRLLAKVLGEYIRVLNSDQLPKVSDVWREIAREKHQQLLEELLGQYNKQIKSIALPLGKQELRLRIGEIENRLGCALEEGPANKDQTDELRRGFKGECHKVRQKLEQKNEQLLKTTLMNQLRRFVKQNINYQEIRPDNISDFMRQSIEVMRVKINGAEEGYEYLLSIIYDIFFIVEQKSAKIDREYLDLKASHEALSREKNSLDLTVINLKREYHEALKSIARLQQQQSEIDKNYALNKNRVSTYESQIAKLKEQNASLQQGMQRQIKEAENKGKNRVDELVTEIKKLRLQNVALGEENSRYKSQLSSQNLLNKKELIFQQKINEIYQKFNSEKSLLTKQLQIYRKQLTTANQRCEQLKTMYENQAKKQKQSEEVYMHKEKSLLKQFQNLKKCIKETRASYEQTYQTIQTSDKVLKEVSNYGASSVRREKEQTPARSRKVVEEVRNVQSQENERNQLEMQKLRHKITQLQKQLQAQIKAKQCYFLQASQYRQKYQALEQDMISSNLKFNEFLKQIEEAKEKQRMLYEQSIVRLLKNIEKNKDSRDSESGMGSELRHRSQTGSIQSGKQNEKGKSWVSFGYRGQI